MPEFLSGPLAAIAATHAAWRYTLISGVIPAIPLILIRPFLPESPVWQQKKAAGTLKRPSFGELFAPELRRTTIVTTIMFACSYGAAFGAIQQSAVHGAPAHADSTRRRPRSERARRQGGQAAKAAISQRDDGPAIGTVQEIGGLVGRFLLAFLAVRSSAAARCCRRLPSCRAC